MAIENKNGLSYSEWVYEKDKSDYILFKNNELDDVTDAKLFEMKTYDLLEKKGYSIDNYGTYLFKELISFLDGYISYHDDMDIIDITNELNDSNSNIYDELLGYLEVPKDKFFEGLKELNKDSSKESCTDQALIFSMYVSKKCKDYNDKKSKRIMSLTMKE